jgi:O-antigen ligase
LRRWAPSVPRAVHRVCLWLALLLVAAIGLQRLVALHLSSGFGRTPEFPAPVRDADVPLLGVNVALEQYGAAELDAVLAGLSDSGFGWVRQSFRWAQIEPQPGRADWTWADRVVAAVALQPSLRLVAVTDGRAPDSPSYAERFAAFCGEFAARYGDRIDYYQIWDEPNLADRWDGAEARPAAYADLLARSASAIRAADPESRILLAGLAPTVEAGPRNWSEVLFLEQLYQAGAAGYFDIVAAKPYGFDTGPDDLRVDESVLNFSRLQLLREVMVRYGDADKPVWASQWGWNALPRDWGGEPSIWGETDQDTQAAWTVAALERARLEWPWMGAMILEHLQPWLPEDDAHRGFSLLTDEGEPRPVYDAVSAWAVGLPVAAPPGGHGADSEWAAYDQGWQVGSLGVDCGPDGSRATFRFEGTAVAVTVRRGPYPGFLYVTVDGEAAGQLPVDEEGRSYLVLYHSSPVLATVPLARGLSEGVHTVEVVAEKAQGRWSLIDWRVSWEKPAWGGVAPLALLGLLFALLLGLAVRDWRRVQWDGFRLAFVGWPEWAQVASLAASVGLLWLAAGASWGRDWASPLFVVSLPLVAVVAVLIAWRLELGLASVALTAPFYLHPENLAYGAISVPELLVLLCAAAFALRRGQRGMGEARGGGQGSVQIADLSVVLLMVAALAAGLAAADRMAALFELRIVFLLPAVYYALLRLAPLERRGRIAVLIGLAAGGVVVALFGLAQYALGQNLVVAEGGLARLQSIYFSPNGAALYLGRIWPLLLAAALWADRRALRLLGMLGAAAVGLALVLTFSRGALLLALPAAVVVMGWRAGRRYRVGAIVLVALLGLALLPLLRIPRFASLLDLEQGTSFFRLQLWRSSLAMIGDSPFLGVGPGNFLEAYQSRYVLPSAWQEFGLGHPHSILLDYLLRTGLLGLLAGVGTQLGFWLALGDGPRESPVSLALAGSMAAVLAHGLVDNSLFSPDLALSFFAVLALCHVGGRTGGWRASGPRVAPGSQGR